MNTTPKPFIKKLIIADDDYDDQILLREAIDDFANPPLIGVVSDGCELIEVLKTGPLPDLVLLDLNMPNKNGIECLLEIRSNPEYTKLPVVVLSTSKDPHDIEACFSSGATLFFSKPYTFKELKTLVHTMLSVDWQLYLERKPTKDEFLAIALKGQFPKMIFAS